MTGNEPGRCGVCGRTRRDTTLVRGKRAGAYNRASASVWRRVCNTCTADRVGYCRTAQAQGRFSPLDMNNQITGWSVAAQRFGIMWADLYRDDYDQRTAWPDRAAHIAAALAATAGAS